MSLSQILKIFIFTVTVTGCKNFDPFKKSNNGFQVVNNVEYILNEENDIKMYSRIDDYYNCKVYASKGLNQVFWTLNTKLLMIQIMNDDDYTETSEGLKNGLPKKNIYDLYSKYPIKKEKSEGAGDTQNNFVYIIKMDSHDLSVNVVNDIIKSYDYSISEFDTNICH